MSYMNSAP